MINPSLPAPPPGRSGWPWDAPPTSWPAAQPNGRPWPRISIVTPSYQQGAFLEATIRSVLLQGYPNLDYSVIDGGSTDESLAIIQKYAPYLSYWVSELDEGQAHAINKGLRRSTGDIMGWLNSDDILLAGALWHIARAFADPRVKVVTGWRKIYDAQGRFRRNSFDGLTTTTTLRYHCTIAQETTYWRREVWERVGELDAGLRYTMDYDYWQRMLDAGYDFTLLPVYLGGFRQHPASKGAQMEAVRQAELSRLYQARNIARDEGEALAKLDQLLGADWRQKRRLLRHLGHSRLSDDPRFFYWLAHLLDWPLVGGLLVRGHRWYSRLRGRPTD